MIKFWEDKLTELTNTLTFFKMTPIYRINTYKSQRNYQNPDQTYMLYKLLNWSIQTNSV